MKHLIWIVPLVIYLITTALFKRWWWMIVPFILGIIIFLVVFLYKGHLDKKEQEKADKKGMKNELVCKDEETEEWVKIPQGFYKEEDSGECVEGTPPTSVATQQVEALVLENECFTPCSSFVGLNYNIRTEGDPLRIKYNGCDWIDRPAKGATKAPKCFRPGEAQFASSDLHVKVQVYRKILIPAP